MQGAGWHSQAKKLGGVQVFNFSASNIRGPLVLWKEDMGYSASPPSGSEHASCYSQWGQSISLEELKSRVLSCFCAGLSHAIQIQAFYLVLKNFLEGLVRILSS